ncbi:protein OSB2 chloroplastic-like isoform X1 [Tripterygium wilfordii]|uniref:Protein OSB2 chloroplastic-like isoform X1 n=1 Tax=Tripterygium wilfordii TaxID=458696 RepID=A0A7J7C650_TRIWF|nr:protein OSB2 chloroplastic-like isoform X1 [Tripterygium wilfordii]
MNTLRRALAKTVSSEWKRQRSFRGLQSYSTKRPDSPPTPRLSEIPYQTKVANSVNLIGRVDQPIEFKASPDGNYCAAATVIDQGRPSATSLGCERFFIPVVFEGDLAHVATCHLKKNDRVCVAGQIAAGPPPLDLMQDHLKDGDDVPIGNVVHVLVRSVSFV